MQLFGTTDLRNGTDEKRAKILFIVNSCGVIQGAEAYSSGFWLGTHLFTLLFIDVIYASVPLYLCVCSSGKANPVSSSPRSACKLEGGPDLRLHAAGPCKGARSQQGPFAAKNAAADAQKPETER
ncbi:hypothetical protein CDAR_366581 [Caerostris darwini]|uniref:Uncharacterized protein n=1 Tax=Caerostris darwini TaxID=1538125 RepID=A0AAV4Q6D0_9ARAC|nr:hypothetical protein CDAR_366581 [Caerostris darwini]